MKVSGSHWQHLGIVRHCAACCAPRHPASDGVVCAECFDIEHDDAAAEAAQAAFDKFLREVDTDDLIAQAIAGCRERRNRDPTAQELIDFMHLCFKQWLKEKYESEKQK